MKRLARLGLSVVVAFVGFQAFSAWQVDGADKSARRLQQHEMFSYHKELLPLDISDFLCFFVAGTSQILAAGGGVGGGGILVPLYMLFLRFRPRHAVALSNITVLGGAMANTGVNLLRRDENGRSLIDWNIIVMMEPATIGGTIVGSFLSKYLADFVLMVFLAVVLAVLSFRTLDKGLEMFWREKDAIPIVHQAVEEAQDSQEVASEEEDAKESRNLVGHSIRTVERDHRTKIGLLVLCFLGCIGLTILKGSGRGSVAGVSCGYVSFWLLTWAALPWVVGFGLIFRDMLIKEHLENEEDGHDYQMAEIRWTAVTTVRYPMLCSLAGVLAGLFGVGGGIIKGPLMLELGVDPHVASATAATMILFTSSAASVSFEVFGLLKADYGAFCFILGFGCTMLGQYAIQRWVQGAHRQSPPVLSIGHPNLVRTVLLSLAVTELSRGFVMALSTLLLLFEIVGHLSSKDFQQLVVPTSLCNINA
ncbi:Sulfite exporter TauE/SafE family protein 1 [Durusdinium trenchii]|uniref:Sulfite exporter TauE/SafE family protein 1 n=1 Tax=Durusdinium trenchii TaxID=1381693 RepID=A0ABP0QEI3_9DINO